MDPRIGRALKSMERMCSEHLDISRYAEEAGLSRWRFEHLFKAQTGLTPRAMLREFCLAKAQGLLADARLRVKEVAYRCGYRSTPTFSRNFRGVSQSPPRSTGVARSDNK